MTVQKLQQNTSWSISWQRVSRWLQAVEPVLALLVGAELATEVVIGLVLWVLEIVLSVGGSLPEIKDSVWDWLLGLQVQDLTVHQSDLAVWSWVLDDGATELTERSAWRPEWAEDGGGGWVAGLRGVLVCNLVNQRLETEDVADSLALVADWGGDLADAVHEVHAGHPLVDGELNLAGEVVEVADEGGHDLALAGWGGWADGVDDMLGEVWVEARLLGGGGGGLLLGRHFDGL